MRGEWQAALQLYDKALGLRPEDPDLLGLKGVVYYQMGDLLSARALLERGLHIAPDAPRLHNYLGLVFMAAGNIYEAEMAFVQAARLQPSYSEAWHNAGKALMLRNKPLDAFVALANALRYAPKDGGILLDMGVACFLVRKVEEAEKHLIQAKSFPAQEPLAKLWLSVVLTDLGRVEEAVALEQWAMAHLGNDQLYDTLLKIGHAYVYVGNAMGAEGWIEKAIQLNKESPRAYIDLSGTRKFVLGDMPLVGKMEALLAAASDEDRKGLEFALGKIHTDLGNYQNSFLHYRAGNDLVRKAVKFEPELHKRVIDTQITQFTRESIAQWPYRSESRVPILIVGTPRSGTTLTESIVSSHSSVAPGGEIDFWGRVAAHIGNAISKGMTPEFSKRVVDEYLMFLRLHSTGAARITDKMPGNFQYLGGIHAFFPKAKIVHVKRHPIDACLSIYFQDFPVGHSYKFDLDSLATWYEEYQRIMAYWRSTLPPGSLYELQYEALVEDQEGESRKLLEFLELDWEDQVLEFHKQDRAVFTASKWQVRQPVYKTSKDRWRRYEEFVEPLLPLLKYA